MRMALPITVSLFMLLVCSGYCCAQTEPADSAVSISGHVTVGGKGAAGIAIAATTSNPPLGDRTVAKTTTDEEGSYLLRGLPPGRLTIFPVAKALVTSADGRYSQPGLTVNASAGESITKMDFTLVRGGVITGRITDQNGHPLIGEHISVVPTHYAGVREQMSFFGSSSRNLTDDRGIYRVYGLTPGTYRVSVGQGASAEGAPMMMGVPGSQHSKTFYPGVTDESKAAIIKLDEGTEATDVDITPGKSARGFSVSGRVVDAESGQPVGNVLVGYSTFDDGNQRSSRTSFTGNLTDANGKFRLEELQPGHYSALSTGLGEGSYSYSDPAPFDVLESDVTGIEVKVRRGVTISGIAVVENNSDPVVAAMLQQLTLYASVNTGATLVTSATVATGAPSFRNGKINPDGSFRLAGLAPGRAHIAAAGFPEPKGLELVRTELNGIDQEQGIEITAAANVTGVRLVFVYGTGSIRGEVKTEGGVLPEGTTFQAFIKESAGDNRRFNRLIEVDARGRFVATDIPPGTYELSLYAIAGGGREIPKIKPVTRTITIANGIETQLVLVINLDSKKSGLQ